MKKKKENVVVERRPESLDLHSGAQIVVQFCLHSSRFCSVEWNMADKFFRKMKNVRKFLVILFGEIVLVIF